MAMIVDKEETLCVARLYVRIKCPHCKVMVRLEVVVQKSNVTWCGRCGREVHLSARVNDGSEDGVLVRRAWED